MKIIFQNLSEQLDYIETDELGNKVYWLFANALDNTTVSEVTNQMQDLIVKCFVLTSVPGFNKKDFNYIKSELEKAGWVL